MLADAGVAAAFGSSLAWFGALVAISVVVARVFRAGAARDSLEPLFIVILAGVLARAGLAWVADDLEERASGSVVHELRTEATSSVAALGPAAVHGERAGELVHALGEGSDRIADHLAGYRPARMLSVAVPVAVAVIVAAIDPWSVVILAVTGPLLVVLLALIGRRVGDATRRREAELTWMSGYFLDVLRGLPTLTMFGRAEEQAERIEEIGHRLARSTMDILRTVFQTSLVLEWGAAAATALVAIEMSVRLLGGEVAFEHALAVLVLTPEFFAPLRRLAAAYHLGPSGIEAASQVFAIIDRPPTLAPAGAMAPSERPSLSFDGVAVRYEAGRRALDGITLEVPFGTFVVVVGPSGGGKTTLANLLSRFVDPTEGSVRADGVPLHRLDVDAWRRSIAIASQRPSFVHGSVAANLRVGKPDATHGELMEALSDAGADAFVGELPGGLDATIGEGGARLSGGQRQRLAIARALLRDAPITILDEATSHLDQASQTAVMDRVRDRTAGRTVLCVAHRSSLMRYADVVVAIERGRVARIGLPGAIATHEEALR